MSVKWPLKAFLYALLLRKKKKNKENFNNFQQHYFDVKLKIYVQRKYSLQGKCY